MNNRKSEEWLLMGLAVAKWETNAILLHTSMTLMEMALLVGYKAKNVFEQECSMFLKVLYELLHHIDATATKRKKKQDEKENIYQKRSTLRTMH